MRAKAFLVATAILALPAGANAQSSWFSPTGPTPASISARRAPRSQRRSASMLFNDLFLETLNKRDHVALFGLGHLKLR
jgi:hypothetical protein